MYNVLFYAEIGLDLATDPSQDIINPQIWSVLKMSASGIKPTTHVIKV